jgi:hypothetical protein
MNTVRTRWIQHPLTLELVPAEEFVAPRMARDTGALWGDLHYRETTGPNGEDLSTRTKHREYLRQTGLTTVDDFSQTWKRDAQKREQAFKGVDPERVRDVARAMDKHRR